VAESPIPDELTGAFARDGVVCVRDVLDPGELVVAARAIDLVLSLRYLSARARHAPRTWRTSPPFDGLARELAAGAAMDHPLFPVVWPTLA
jgi:hypothetical protein